MELFIQTLNGQTVNHPAFKENLIQAFGQIPADWEPFVRIARPVPNVYEVLESEQPTYQKVDGVWKDVWALRPMTTEEKAAKQQEVKDYWAKNGFASWIFNEATCTFDPPTLKPNDGKQYRWDEPTTSWVEVG